MTDKVVLCLFNLTDTATEPWLEAGVSVVSVDIQHPHRWASQTYSSGATHYRTNQPVTHSLDLHGLEVGLVISFAPCTDLAVSGAKHWEAKRARDPMFQHRALGLALDATLWGVPYMVENPVSALATLWRKPDHYWHPWHYAGYCPEGPHPLYPDVIPEQDRYNKKSCLWVGNGFVIPDAKPLPPLSTDNPGWAKLGGKSLKTKNIRSATPRGFSRAVFEANKHHLGLDKGYRPMVQLEMEV